MSDRNSPIGILDSGIGGFSVVRQVQRLLPNEDLIYFGDGANVPYGNHTAQTIVDMSRYMLEFMQQHKVKVLLVACNTISCIIDQCADAVSCPIFNTVQAGADGVAALDVERVGVISTVFTHNTRIYPRMIQAGGQKNIRVLSCGCPDLARLVEHNLGHISGMVQMERELEQALRPMVDQEQIQCCVLGCTHYSLISEEIRRLYPALPLVDPAQEMARALREYLEREDLTNQEREQGTLSIYTTGDTEEYVLRAKQVGLEQITGVSYYPPKRDLKNER